MLSLVPFVAGPLMCVVAGAGAAVGALRHEPHELRGGREEETKRRASAGPGLVLSVMLQGFGLRVWGYRLAASQLCLVREPDVA
eukprot:3653470-Rhodomonas_salina.1